MAAYNHPYGMAAGQETQAINPSIRDANGNLTVVNGQITSGSVSRQTGVQTAGANVSGSGTKGSGAIFGGATAIGNSLNVVTYGSNNTVIVNSKQTNNGDQNANVSINGH
jgi:holdfast attachment protein HfaA